MREFCIGKLSHESQDMEKSNAMWNKRAKEFASNIKEQETDVYIEFLKKQVKIQGESFLDIGCGAGKYIKLLLDEGALVEGIEPSIEMIKEARIYLQESGYNAKDIVFYNQSFQDFKEEKQYDYIFLSNSPVISFYENYKKILQLAKKGIFIGSWMGNKDSLLDKVTKILGQKPMKHGSQNIRYFFELFMEDGYFPNFETVLEYSNKEIHPDSLYQRYASWFFGADYTFEDVNRIKKIIEKEMIGDKVFTQVASAKGMIFVDLKKRLD